MKQNGEPIFGYKDYLSVNVYDPNKEKISELMTKLSKEGYTCKSIGCIPDLKTVINVNIGHKQAIYFKQGCSVGESILSDVLSIDEFRSIYHILEKHVKVNETLDEIYHKQFERAHKIEKILNKYPDLLEQLLQFDGELLSYRISMKL